MTRAPFLFGNLAQVWRTINCLSGETGCAARDQLVMLAGTSIGCFRPGLTNQRRERSWVDISLGFLRKVSWMRIGESEAGPMTWLTKATPSNSASFLRSAGFAI